MAVLIPHEDKFKLRSDSIYWPEEVAVLILHEDKFKIRSNSIYWPEGVAVLIMKNNLKFLCHQCIA